MSDPIKVPSEVLQGLETVRRSGQTNMFDYHAVMRLAHDWDHHATVAWLADNKQAYGRGIFHGFEANDTERARREQKR